MSVFSRGTASRSRVRTVIGGIAIAGASALVLAGCAGGGGTAEPSESAAPAEDLTLKIGTVLPQTGSLAFLGPPEEAGVAARRQRGQRGRGHGVDRRRRLRRLGRHRQQGLRDHDPEAQSEGVSAMIGAASSGCHQAVPRQQRQRGHHHVLAGQHVARLHDVGRQRPVLAHRSLATCCRARCSAT